MKKGKFFKTLAIFGVCLGAPLLLTGCQSGDNDLLEFRVQDGYVQYTKDGKTWENIVSSNELKGEQGKGIKRIMINNSQSDATKTTYIIVFDDNTTYSYVVKNGINGTNGKDGEDGSVVTIGEDGYWYIDGVKTDVKARGEDGSNGTNGSNGEDGQDGKDGNGIKSITIDQANSDATKTTYIITFDDNTTYSYVVKNGTNGEDGEDGSVVTIGEDGYWYIDGVKTDVKARGEDGTDGTNGKDAEIDFYTITYDYGAADTFFAEVKETETIKATQWLTTLPEINEEYKESFLGWFISGTEKQIQNYDFVGGNVTLEARFDRDKLGLSGLYYNGKYVKTWNSILEDYPSAVVNNEILSYDVTSGSVGMPHSYFENFAGDLVIDNSVIKIGDSAFARCLNLTSVTLPNSIESVGRYAFEGSTNICNEYEGAYYVGNASNPYMALVGWKSLNLTINSNCKVISEYLFKGSQIEQITIPQNIKTLPKNIFESCLHLTDVTIENGLEIIDEYAFYNCNYLVNISVPNSVKEVGKYAFGACRKLKTNKYENASYIGNEENPYLIYLGITYDAELCNLHTDCKIMSTTSLTYSVPTYTQLIISKNVQQIGYESIASSSLAEIYYLGAQSDWDKISINERNKISNATIYYYFEKEEDVPTDGGNYWHYDTDGKTPIIWEATE